MRVKVFTAATMQEAMAKVKGELGMDAVILHTKRFHKGGFLGYLGKEMVEVTAAVEDAPKIAKTKAIPKEVVLPKNVVENYTMNTVLEQEKMLRTSVEEAQKETGKRIPDVELNLGDGLLEAQQAQKIQQLQHELDNMKIMLEKVMCEAEQHKEETKSLLEILRDQEVQDAVAQDIIAEVFDESILMNRDSKETVEVLTQYFARMFRPPHEICIAEERCKVVALIGTTGVGKTTTIAKLAANFVLEKGCSVALITADTYRISAVEQLKTYSDIIGVPLEIVYSPVELKAAINKHSDKKLVLIDTAGRSQHNEFQLTELQEMLLADDGIERHLVLSATTKYKDAVDIVRKFSICKPDSLLFTKIDETGSIGVIVNIIHQYPILLSYFTNGQSVPDDIFSAQPDKLAELIMR